MKWFKKLSRAKFENPNNGISEIKNDNHSAVTENMCCDNITNNVLLIGDGAISDLITCECNNREENLREEILKKIVYSPRASTSSQSQVVAASVGFCSECKISCDRCSQCEQNNKLIRSDYDKIKCIQDANDDIDFRAHGCCGSHNSDCREFSNNLNNNNNCNENNNNLRLLINGVKENYLSEQAKILENFISVPTNSCLTGVSPILIDREIIDPEDFFQDPDEVIEYLENKKFLADYCFVNKEDFEDCIDSESQHDSKIDDNNKIDESVDDINKISECDNNCDLVDSHITSDISTNILENMRNDNVGVTSSCSKNSEAHEAESNHNLTNDIQLGMKMAIIKTFCIWSDVIMGTCEPLSIGDCESDKSKSDKILNDKKRKFTCLDSDDEAFASSLMGPVLENGTHLCPLYKSAFQCSSIKHERERKSPTFSVRKYFGLNEIGDIIIHLDHVIEYQGFGYLNKYDVGKVPIGVEVTEKRRWWKKFGDIFDGNIINIHLIKFIFYLYIIINSYLSYLVIT